MTQSVVSDKKSFLLQIIPVMLCFFAMGFVDLVGTASNYVQKALLSVLSLFLYLCLKYPGKCISLIYLKMNIIISIALHSMFYLIMSVHHGVSFKIE